jgi:hypothetical protein
MVILSGKAGWLRQDDELAAHERALRALGWRPVTLPVRPQMDHEELAGFIDRAAPSVVWVRGDVALPDGFAALLEVHPAPVVRQGPAGVDQAILDAAASRPPWAVRGDVSVVSSAPSSLLRRTVEQLGAHATVVAYGDWPLRPWFEPAGRALVVALRSATVHLAEVGPDGSLPHTAYVAAATGTALLLLDEAGRLDAFEPGTEVISAGSADDAEAALARPLADAATRARLTGAARSKVAAAFLLEPQWRTRLDEIRAGP